MAVASPAAGASAGRGRCQLTGSRRSGHAGRVTAVELLGRCTFPPPGTAVDCAVSGGADSLALLVLAVAAGNQVTAIHVDHGLREGSATEADVVAAAAARYGAGFRAERVRVEPGPNLEARARAARHSVLPPGALTGHTADDQAETVLLNLVRGAGLDGLAGMAPERHPLLGLRRRETHALCREAGLEWVDDPSNRDPAHLRNRVRAELLPLLDDLAGRDVVAVLARQAAMLRAEAAILDALAGDLDATDARALAAAPAPMARRAVRAWLRTDGVEAGHPPDQATVERVLGVARGEARAADVGGGRRVVRSRQRLSLESGHGVRATQAGHGVRATQAGHGVRATQAGDGVRATQAGGSTVGADGE